MEEATVGDARLNETCSNVHVINELGVPILVMGGMVVSASPEGILVSDKEQSSYIKPFVDAIEQQPVADDFTSVDEQQGIHEFFDQGADDGDNGLTIIYGDEPEEVIIIEEDPVVYEETPAGEFAGEFIEGE